MWWAVVTVKSLVLGTLESLPLSRTGAVDLAILPNHGRDLEPWLSAQCHGRGSLVQSPALFLPLLFMCLSELFPTLC